MLDRQSRLLNVTVFIILEAVSLYLLISGSPQRRQAVDELFTVVGAALWRGPEKIRVYMALREENSRLAEENAALISTIMDAKRGEVSGGRWNKMRLNYMLLPAEIVTITTGSLHNCLIVDKGRDDGVEPDDGVITDNGVVGIISHVSANYSLAISYANRDMTVSAKTGRDGISCSIRWDGTRSGESIVGGIPIHATGICAGDTVFTSGFSTIFPPDIPLGTIIGKISDNGNSSEYRMMMFDDLSKINHIYIVRNLDRKEIKSLTDAE